MLTWRVTMWLANDLRDPGLACYSIQSRKARYEIKPGIAQRGLVDFVSGVLMICGSRIWFVTTPLTSMPSVVAAFLSE